MKKFLCALLLTLVAPAFAANTTTVVRGKWVLRDPTTTPIAELGRYDTEALCTAASPVGKFRCDTSVNVTVVNDCVGTKPPTIVLVKNAEGFFEEPDAFAALVDGQWITLQNLYVPAPPGAATCWIRGLAPHDSWRLNGTNPNAPFMELITPGMPPLADTPSFDSETPTWSDEKEVLYWNEYSVARRAIP